MRTRIALLAASSIAALFLAGCGGSGSTTPPASAAPTATTAADNGVAAMPAADILTKSLAALSSAGSAHLTGKVDTSTVDVLTSGSNLQIKSTGPDGTLEARLIGTDLYYKGDAAFYKAVFPAPQGDQLATQRADKWVKSSAAKDPQVSNVVSLLNPGNLLQVIVLAAQPTKGAATQVDGKPAIEITFTAPSGSGSIFVATTGAPVPLQVKLQGVDQPIAIGYGDPVTIAPPTVEITA